MYFIRVFYLFYDILIIRRGPNNYIKEERVMWIYIIIAFIVVILLYLFILYNVLTKQQNRVEEAFSTMDVYLKKRWDLIFF